MARRSVRSDSRIPAPGSGVASGVRHSAILIIDDSATHRAELRRTLESSGEFGEITEAADGPAGLKALLLRPFDAVICDIELPGFDGEKLLAAKAQRPELADTPILFVSANRNPERKARLLERGASDTIEKPFHPAELLARLGVHLRLQQLRSELREKNRLLEQLSTTDALTGLRNRRFAERFIGQEIERTRRHGNELSVFMADLDHFKRVNDSFGHGVGDAALRHTAAVLSKQMRKTDVAARWGGEEFLFALVEVPLAGAAVFAERQRAALEATPLVLADGRSIELTASIGVAALLPGHTELQALLAAVDQALYAAKDAGRNRVLLARQPG